MGKRGPKRRLHVQRKWWVVHKITLRQIDRIIAECQEQLPLFAHKIDSPILISALVARAAKEVDMELFDANDIVDVFRIEDEGDPEEELVEEEATGADV